MRSRAQLEQGGSGELVIGIVAPVGTDSSKVHLAVAEVLREFDYESVLHKLSSQFSDPKIVAVTDVEIEPSPDFKRIRSSMDAGDQLRSRKGRKEILGVVAAASIAVVRDTRTAAQVAESGAEDECPHPVVLDRVAHVVHSLKRPEEAFYLSRVYGGRFLLISLYAPREERLRNLVQRGMSEPEAVELIVRDESGHGSPLPKEKWEFGQATRDTFHRADMFIDATDSDVSVKKELRRFFDLVFGCPLITPRKHEHAMFLAFAASLRSGDLSRQVGAVLTTDSGMVVADGANDAPGPFAVPYWPDGPDARDIALGTDSNEIIKLQRMETLRGKLAEAVQRSPGLDDDIDEREAVREAASRLVESALAGEGLRRALKEAGFLDITEFGRAVHAEMSALMSCASRGVSTRGLTLYCTTFPCHNCTKHLVAAGVEHVVFIEPYPKSKALELHSDAISLTNEKNKVEFSPFVGIGPKRYVELFVLRDLAGQGLQRKDKEGKLKSWSRQEHRPVVSDRVLTYIEREMVAVVLMTQALDGHSS